MQYKKTLKRFANFNTSINPRLKSWVNNKKNYDCNRFNGLSITVNE